MYRLRCFRPTSTAWGTKVRALSFSDHENAKMQHVRTPRNQYLRVADDDPHAPLCHVALQVPGSDNDLVAAVGDLSRVPELLLEPRERAKPEVSGADGRRLGNALRYRHVLDRARGVVDEVRRSRNLVALKCDSAHNERARSKRPDRDSNAIWVQSRFPAAMELEPAAERLEVLDLRAELYASVEIRRR